MHVIDGIHKYVVLKSRQLWINQNDADPIHDINMSLRKIR